MTGATGFLGSNLTRALLEKGFRITALKRSSSSMSRISDIADKMELYDLDNSSLEDVFSGGRFDIILHCATNYGRQNNNRLNVMDANLMLPLKLLEMGIKHDVPCFINTDTLLDKRINYYSLSKQQFKEWLTTYSNDMVCINVALEHFYGPFDDTTKFVSFVIDKILNDADSVDLTPGEQKRDFIYIDDVIAAFTKIIENAGNMDKGYHSFEIGTGQLIKIKELASMIKQLAGNKVTRLNFGALPYRENEIMESKVDISAIKRVRMAPEIFHQGRIDEDDRVPTKGR